MATRSAKSRDDRLRFCHSPRKDFLGPRETLEGTGAPEPLLHVCEALSGDPLCDDFLQFVAMLWPSGGRREALTRKELLT
jgi:hypothetical protein